MTREDIELNKSVKRAFSAYQKNKNRPKVVPVETDPKDEQADDQIPLAQLHSWPEERRAAPSGIFRSALFPALARKKRIDLKDVPIYSVKGVTVLFSGEQFDQSDLEILHMMRGKQSEVSFTTIDMLKALGKKIGWTYQL
jgi:hypothetical protein